MLPVLITLFHLFIILVVIVFVIFSLLAASGRFDHWATRYTRRSARRKRTS